MIFWNDIGCFLVRSVQYAYAHASLSITQRQGIITCIPKGDKSREYPKNWRPITLLNADYKIFSGVLAARLKAVLLNVISSSQKFFFQKIDL